MRRWIGMGMVTVLGLGWGGAAAPGQVIERNLSVTGPRGRTIDRSVTTERGPGFIDRQVNITRPGGSFHSNTIVPRPGGMAWGRPPGWGGGGWWGPRTVFVNGGGGGWGWNPLGTLAVGGGLFGLGALTGAALSSQPAPPPVYAAPVAPAYAAQAQPPVVYNPPQPYNPNAPQMAQQPPVVVDPVADAMVQLRDQHDHIRRDSAYALGKLGDPRAVPVLVERLKYDGSKDVRVAAATALGQIGDPRASVFLERATIYDHKQDVRDAAGTALAHMPRQVPSQAANPTQTAGYPGPGAQVPNLSAPPTSLEPIENVPPPPTPVAGPAVRNAP